MDLCKRCHYNYNWLMYLNFVRQDQEAVQNLYNKLPEERRDEQMYKAVQGLSSKLQGHLHEAHSQLIEAIDYNTMPHDESVVKSGEVCEINLVEKSSDRTATHDGDFAPSSEETDFSANVLAQYLAVEDVAALALHGQFNAALATSKRLFGRFDASNLASLWKLPFFKTFIMERKLTSHALSSSSLTEQQYNDAISVLKDELTSLSVSCNEDLVYQALARLPTHLPSKSDLPDAKQTASSADAAAAETNSSVVATYSKDVIEQALEKHPANVDLVNTLIRSFLVDDRYDAVLRTLLAQNSNTLKYSQNIDFAFVAGLAGDLDTSLTRAKLAACQSAYSSAAWNNIAVSLIERRKHVTGIGSMRFSRSLDATNWIVLHNLGFVHLKMGLHASAVIFLTAAYRYGGAQNAATVFLLSMCVSELGNLTLAKKLLQNASRVVKQHDVPVLVFLIPALIEVGEYGLAIELYQRFADMVKYMRGDSIRHQQMRRSELSHQLDYFATHVPDIVQLLIFIQQELPGKHSLMLTHDPQASRRVVAGEQQGAAPSDDDEEASAENESGEDP